MATYKYGGSSDPNEVRSDLILEGSILNPQTVVLVGETVELDDEKVKELRASGHKLTKTDSESEESREAAAPDSDTPDQPASGAQHSGTDPAKDNTPAGRSQRTGGVK